MQYLDSFYQSHLIEATDGVKKRPGLRKVSKEIKNHLGTDKHKEFIDLLTGRAESEGFHEERVKVSDRRQRKS